jgi:hypothetical protein
MRSGASTSEFYYSNNNMAFGVGQRHRTIQSNNEKVMTVTNEPFKHIIYYPVFNDLQIIAILEVGYKKKNNE